MLFQRCFGRLFVLFVFGVFVGLSPLVAADSETKKSPQDNEKLEPLTPVQVLVFDEPHMSNVKPGQTLAYVFERKSLLKDGYSDVIDLKVTAGDKPDVRTVEFDFFRNERRRPYPSMGYVSSNPLLTIYFNKDAWDLARRIKAKGVVNYLRNRILDGLAKGGEISQSTCSYQGKDVPAKKIVFEPFAKDKNKHHLVYYSAIRYELTLAPSVPGGVCEIISSVPYPTEKIPDHFLAKLKKSGMLSLAKEAEQVNKLEKTDQPLIVERVRFDKVFATE